MPEYQQKLAFLHVFSKTQKVTVLLHPKFSLAKIVVHKYNKLAYEICAFSVSLRTDKDRTKESEALCGMGEWTAVPAALFLPAADGWRVGTDQWQVRCIIIKRKRDEKTRQKEE